MVVSCEMMWPQNISQISIQKGAGREDFGGLDSVSRPRCDIAVVGSWLRYLAQLLTLEEVARCC